MSENSSQQPAPNEGAASARPAAIQVLSSYVTQAIHEMCDTPEEFKDCHAEARDAFNVLGVTDAELGWNGRSF